MHKPPVPELSETALFLDIDGTLVEHAPHPDGVVVAPELPGILQDLNSGLEGAIAFVTGRDLMMVERLFGQTEFGVAGTFGIERVLGAMRENGQDAARLVAPIFAELEAQFKENNGVYFEHKGPVLAIHCRASPESLPAVLSACRASMPLLPEGYRMLEGHAGVELLPEGATKSAAIEWFMSHSPFEGRRPFFLGDDTSDEVGFEWVNKNGGISIRIGPIKPTAARYALETVDEVHDWLINLARAT